MHLTGKLSELTRNLYLEISSRLQAQPMTVLYRVPYTSQFASPEYAEKVLLKNIPASFDPIWLETGATSAEEYVTWVTTICGMACTVMALEYFKQTKHQTISLARDAFSHHVYQLHRKELLDYAIKNIAPG